MSIFKRVANSNATLGLAGFFLASYFRLIGLTNRRRHEPSAEFYRPFTTGKPFIIALWHGEHFLLPFLDIPTDKLNILITTHRDGEMLARACGDHGLKCIRGSGGDGAEFLRKKALHAFTAMLRVLRKGESVVMTADVPKVSRVAGLGIVTVAKHAGCPIIPLAMATSRFRRLSNWGPHLHQPAVRGA